ncbi:nitronate monooxygenase [Nocardioidaceae bacterium SCSIO 66511]|nr:nitronate monooxygenase [Nocardioidaceae bacterium SCSIO 66511]
MTRQFGLAVPVISAPMAGPGDGALAAAVSAAGGLGMVGVGGARDSAWIAEQGRLAGADGRPFGFGLMAWALQDNPDQLEAVAAAEPALVSVSFGAFEPHVSRLANAGITVAVQAGNLADARRAEDAGADLVVARGAEGGGHGRDAVGTLPLLQYVLEEIDTPVAVAGGIAGPRGLAAVLAAGAVGGWVGTAFLGCREAANTPAARRMLLETDDTDTAYGRVFDVAQRHAWPPEFGGRALRNAYFDRWADRLEELAVDDDAARRLQSARAAEDYDTAYLYAGQGVGMLTEERSVADVIADFAKAEELLRGW